MADYVISVYLDTRRKKHGNLYPVKLRVYCDYQTRHYPTGIDLTKEDFDRSYAAERPRSEYKDLKLKILSHLARAKSVADNLKTFDFDKFEKKLLRPAASATDVFHHYGQVIAQLSEEGRIGTAANYNLSAKSLNRFLEHNRRKTDYLSFDAITSTFLKEYEKWMLESGKSRTTVGIYLRPLRALFNAAISEGEIEKDLYPFGKKRYAIPAGRNVKKAFTKEDLKKLFEYELPDGSPMAKARDFFFFSYGVNGINVKDIAELRYQNINADTLSFYRAKTKNTTKTNLKPIVAALPAFAHAVIKKYGNKNHSPEMLVFPILEEGLSEAEKHRRVQAFTRFLNQHLKNLARLVGVDENISTYYARHSFTTQAIQNGASLEFIQDSLGHNSMQTTMNYWSGFSDKVKKEVAEKLMDF